MAEEESRAYRTPRHLRPESVSLDEGQDESVAGEDAANQSEDLRELAQSPDEGVEQHEGGEEAEPAYEAISTEPEDAPEEPEAMADPQEMPVVGYQEALPYHAAEDVPPHFVDDAGTGRRRRAWPLVLGIVLVLLLVGVFAFVMLVLPTMRPSTTAGTTPSDATAAVGQVDEGEQVAEPEETTPAVDISVKMIGDILLHEGVYNSGLQADGTYRFDHLFAQVADEIRDADIAIVNQETPLAGVEMGLSGYPQFNGPKEVADAEVNAGFNVVTKATNHAMDRGYEAVAAELDYWHENHPEVAVIGEADPQDPTTSSDDVYVYEKDGFKVALVNYTYGLNGIPDPEGAVSMLDEDHIAATMAKAREAADMVVAVTHWGEEYILEAQDSQRQWAELLVDEGADVIIGGHPHVLEPLELLEGPDGKKVPCFWSIGNFVSDQTFKNETLLGGMAEVTLHKDSDGTCSVTSAKLAPVVTAVASDERMTAYLLRDWTDDLATTYYGPYGMISGMSMMPEWANEFCSELFGAGYDEATGEFTLSL